MLEVGSVNKKNTKNILVKNIFDACIAAIMWYAVGSSLAGGNGDDFTSHGRERRRGRLLPHGLHGEQVGLRQGRLVLRLDLRRRRLHDRLRRHRRARRRSSPTPWILGHPHGLRLPVPSST